MTPDPFLLRCIEEWTGRRQPRNSMKITFYLVLAFVLTFFLLGLAGCVTETTTTRTTTAKGHVVEVVTVTKKADPAAIALASTVATAYAPPRALVVRQEKSGPVRKHLRGWQGRSEVAAGTERISKEEIEKRRR